MTKASKSDPLALVSKAPSLVGKSVEGVSPVTKAAPAESTAIPMPLSMEDPPR